MGICRTRNGNGLGRFCRLKEGDGRDQQVIIGVFSMACFMCCGSAPLRSSAAFNDKATGKIILIQQRLHEDDLPAYMLKKGYRHLNLPTVAEKEETIPVALRRVHRRTVGDLLNPSREDKATLDQLRRDLGPVVFSAHYQQEPVTAEGNMIQMEWFGTYDEVPDWTISSANYVRFPMVSTMTRSTA